MTEWWDEDPELFSATIGLLAAWDGGTPDRQCFFGSSSPTSPSMDSDSSGSVSGSCSRSCAPKRTINVSRERRKQELQYLRKKTHDLEILLCDLRNRRDAQLRLHYRDAARTQLATVAPIWERMAIRQFQSRKRSEALNAQLKTMLTAQYRVAQDLMRAIQLAEQRSREIGPMKAALVRMPIDVSQYMSEEAQLAHLKMMCAKWEPEIHRCTKAGMNAENELQFLNLHVVKAFDNETVVETVTSSVLPYSVRRVEEKLWSVWSESASAEEEDGEAFAQDAKLVDNVAIGVLSVATKVNGARGAFHGKFVSERLRPTATQSLLVLHMQSDASGFANQLDGVTILEETWIRLIDAKELGQTQLSGTLTVVQHVRRERIIMNKTVDDVHNRMETVTNIMMKQIREEIEYAQQILEDMLISGSGGCGGGGNLITV